MDRGGRLRLRILCCLDLPAMPHSIRKWPRWPLQAENRLWPFVTLQCEYSETSFVQYKLRLISKSPVGRIISLLFVEIQKLVRIFFPKFSKRFWTNSQWSQPSLFRSNNQTTLILSLAATALLLWFELELVGSCTVRSTQFNASFPSWVTFCLYLAVASVCCCRCVLLVAWQESYQSKQAASLPRKRDGLVRFERAVWFDVHEFFQQCMYTFDLSVGWSSVCTNHWRKLKTQYL